MEIYQVKSFLAVVEEESVTKAAKRLFTTPPSVSAHIKALEEELGVRLFERSAKGMKLTSEGVAIRDKADRLLTAAVEISSQAARLRGQVLGGVEIGLNTDPAFLRATRLAGELRASHPGLELNFVCSDSYRIIDAIRTENLDAGFSYSDWELRDFQQTHLLRVELGVAVPIQWQEEIQDGDWETLASHPWVYSTCYCAFHTQLEMELKQRDLVIASHVKCDSDEMRCELISNGMGIGILEMRHARQLEADGTAFIWKSDTPFFLDLRYVCLKRRSDEPAIAATRKAIEKIWKQEASLVSSL